jgi:hypothetical protein
VLSEHRVGASVVCGGVKVERAPLAAGVGPPSLTTAVLARLKAAQRVAGWERIIAPGSWSGIAGAGREADLPGGEVDQGDEALAAELVGERDRADLPGGARLLVEQRQVACPHRVAGEHPVHQLLG